MFQTPFIIIIIVIVIIIYNIQLSFALRFWQLAKLMCEEIPRKWRVFSKITIKYFSDTRPVNDWDLKSSSDQQDFCIFIRRLESSNFCHTFHTCLLSQGFLRQGIDTFWLYTPTTHHCKLNMPHRKRLKPNRKGDKKNKIPNRDGYVPLPHAKKGLKHIFKTLKTPQRPWSYYPTLTDFTCWVKNWLRP